MIIKNDTTLKDALEQFCTVVQIESEETLKLIREFRILETWYYSPFWYKRLPDGSLETYSFDDLPQNLKEYIKELREGKFKGTEDEGSE